MAIFTSTGIDDITQFVLGITTSFSMQLNLYVNPYTVAIDSIPSNFVPLVVGGYSAVTFSGVNWTGGTVAGVSMYNYEVINFTFDPYSGSPILIYGYYVLNLSTGNTVFGETSITPYTIPFTGGGVELYPTWVFENLPP